MSGPIAPLFKRGRKISAREAPLKIAILAHLKHPIRQPFLGGLEMHTHLLARRLLARGHDVTLFAAEGSDPTIGTVAICPPTGEATGDVAHDAAIDAAEDAAYVRMIEEVRRGGFDVVHNNSLHSLPLYRRDRLGAPMVSVLHTPPFDPLDGGMQDAARDTTILAVSRTLAAEWSDLVPDAIVVGNGIELGAFPFAPIPAPDTHAFWSGRIVPEKGLHLAIEAARKARMHLVFAGPLRHYSPFWRSEIAPRPGP